MGSKKKTAKSTTTSELPTWLSGPLQQATQAALGDFRNPSQDIFGSLDQQFNRAADLTRTRLDSEFSTAGRNLGASMPARSQDLQDLALGIFSPERVQAFDPTSILINRLSQLVPGAGGTTTSQTPYFKSGLF